MPNLNQTANLAQRKGLNYTGRLTHAQVVALANAWRPEVRYYEDERFHPVDMDGLFSIPSQIFDTLTPASQDEFSIAVDGASFAPPVLKNGNNVVGNGNFDVEEITSLDIDGGTILTHGKSFSSSTQFFGATTTVNGLPNPVAGDPRRPRHDIVYRAEMRMLFEALKFELELDDLLQNESKPEDSIWRGFEVENSFFRENKLQGNSTPFSTNQKRQILKTLVDSYDPDNIDIDAENTAIDNLISALPQGWLFNRVAWDVIKNFAFIEFYFIYAYNDFDRYESPFGNKHEGDDEGCCVVFDRSKLNQMADDDQTNPPSDIPPHAFITSAHEEWQGGDRIDADISVDPVRARDDLVAYVARGSHATLLEAGTHDVLDFGDAFLLPFKGPTWVAVLNGLTLGIPGLILAIAEHFADSEDVTSNDGVSTPGRSSEPTDEVLVFRAETQVTPLSNINSDENIYNAANGQNPLADPLAALGRRAFSGKIGAHDGFSDKSPKFKTKTARFYRKLLRAVESGAVRLPGPIID